MAKIFAFCGIPLTTIAKQTWADIRADDVFGRAAQLAYYFFFALFPFLICVIASLSVFGIADRGRALLFHMFGQALPAAAFEIIDMTFTGIIRASGPLKMSVGIVVAAWSASMGMSAIMDGLNAAYKVQENRSIVRQYSVALGLTIATAILCIISIAILVFGDIVIDAFLHGGIVETFWKIVQWPIVIALLLLVLALTYHFAPNRTGHQWKWVTPGAIFALLVWIGVSIGLRIYVHFFGSYSAMYGSLGAVIVLLLWFYLTGIAVLSGGVLNGVCERHATGVRRDSRAPQIEAA